MTRARAGSVLSAYRWFIGIGLWLVLTALQLHGSSIGLYAHLLGQPELDPALAGISRITQIDEWGVFTPFIFSQYFDGGNGTFQYVSQLVRAAPTDVSLVYGVPCWHIVTLFRPFLWGYLFLPPAFGLAFFWTGRLIILFLASYELGLVLTQRNGRIAGCYAFMLTFSQMVQFWFAENSFVEMLIFGQLGIALLYRYSITHSLKHRLILMFGLVYCLDGYILTLYPAWQISFGYVFLILAIWVIGQQNLKASCSSVDGWLLLLGILLAAIPVAVVVHDSWATIQAFMQSVYPGQRHSMGGGEGVSSMLRYEFDFLLPFIYFFQYSPLDTTTFVSFAPLPVLASLWVWWKNKTLDRLILLSLGLTAVLYCYCFWPWPSFLAKFRFFTAVPETRMIQAIDFLQLLILVRLWSMGIPAMAWKGVIGITGSYLLIIFMSMAPRLSPLQQLYGIPVMMIFSLLAAFCVFRYQKRLLLLFVMVTVCFGMTINPVARGIQCIYGTELAQQISALTQQDRGKWLVDSDDKHMTYNVHVFNNYPLFFGAPTINSSNFYVDWSRWQEFPLTEDDRTVLNRSCYMNVAITDHPTSFFCPNKEELVANIVNVKINVCDLKRLDVTYVLSKRDLTVFSNSDVVFEQCGEGNKLKIYHVKYME